MPNKTYKVFVMCDVTDTCHQNSGIFPFKVIHRSLSCTWSHVFFLVLVLLFVTILSQAPKIFVMTLMNQQFIQFQKEYPRLLYTATLKDKSERENENMN